MAEAMIRIVATKPGAVKAHQYFFLSPNAKQDALHALHVGTQEINGGPLISRFQGCAVQIIETVETTEHVGMLTANEPAKVAPVVSPAAPVTTCPRGHQLDRTGHCLTCTWEGGR